MSSARFKIDRGVNKAAVNTLCNGSSECKQSVLRQVIAGLNFISTSARIKNCCTMVSFNWVLGDKGLNFVDWTEENDNTATDATAAKATT